MGWTDDQIKAITERDKNLLISAAAGSGKTAVLVERIITLIIKDGIDIDRLLIVTFTNAAAAEMRERIAAALAKALEEGSDQELIRRQLHLLPKASISTLHAFCSTVIRKHFYRLGMPPDFKIGETTELTLLKKEAISEVLEDAYEQNDPEFIALVEAYSENKGDHKLEELLMQVYAFIQSQPDPLTWFDIQIKEHLLSEQEVLESSWIAAIKDSVALHMDGIRQLLTQALHICALPNGPAVYKEAILGDLENIAQFESDLLLYFEGRISRTEMSAISHKKLKSIKKDSEVDPFLQEKVKELRNAYKEYLKNLQNKGFLSRDLKDYVSDLHFLYPRLSGLAKIVRDFHLRYGQKKKEKGLVDFNDLEHMALELLAISEVAEGFKNQYECIFIDEYQDSNIVQETIINRIKRDHNLFFVGDVKQSIYRFRLADPSLFIDKYERYSYEGLQNKRINLSKNFRSRSEILESVNYIFRMIMSKNIGDIDYSDDAWLYPGETFSAIDDPETEVHIIDKDEAFLLPDSEQIDDELSDLSDAEAEALLLTSRIKELLGTDTYDNKNKIYRKITYKDIVVLMRSARNRASVFHEMFIKEGFPVYIDENAGYFETLEIKIFMNLLSVIDNKRNDLALLSAMRSAVFNFSAAELLKIRQCQPKGSYHQAVLTYAKKENNPLAEKINGMICRLDQWKQQAMSKKIDDFLWELMLETGFYYLAGSWPGGSQRQANLMILTERAASFAKTGRSGLFSFIKYAQLFQKASGDMGNAKTIGENENVLRVMTIHKSKGLEFPVVMVAGIGRPFNMGDTRGALLLHKHLGPGLQFADPDTRTVRDSLPQMAIRYKVKMESLSEELRVLYVAMTRAKDRLILVGTTAKLLGDVQKWDEPLSEYKVLSSKSYLDWLGACLIRHPDGQMIRDLLPAKVMSDSELKSKEISKWRITVTPKQSLIVKQADAKEKKETMRSLLDTVPDDLINQPLQSEISRRFNWQYPFKTPGIPSKITVSDIKKAERQGIESLGIKIAPLVRRPGFLTAQTSMTNAEKGTVIHFFMQHADLKRVRNARDINQQIEEMTKKELLTAEEAQVIDVAEVLGFFGSSLGQRMMASDQVQRETGFVYPMPACEALHQKTDCREPIYVQGVIDCWFKENGDIILLDYKSDQVIKDQSELIAKYGAQICIYRDALEKITGQKIKESYIYSFSLKKEILVCGK